jgi:hypothetical protein
MDLFDLRNSLAYGRSIEEVADFPCRSDTVEEVRRKAEELGCYSPSKAAFRYGKLKLNRALFVNGVW